MKSSFRPKNVLARQRAVIRSLVEKSNVGDVICSSREMSAVIRFRPIEAPVELAEVIPFPSEHARKAN